MASSRIKFFRFAARLLVRRKSWGQNAAATAQRARRIFGAPRIWQSYVSLGLKIKRIEEKNIRGEWIVPQSDAAAQDKIIFYIHGGGYVSCSPNTHRPITATLARRTKLKVFALDYRLAPENPFPATLEDVVAAYQWLIEQNYDAKKIAVAGDSAGGGLVVSLLLRLREMSLPLPACVVCFSPWTDMTASGESIRENAERDAIFHPENVHEFARAALGNVIPPTNKYASPALIDKDNYKDFPPVLFQVGDREILLDDARRVFEKIKAGGSNGGESELETYEGVFHGWQMLGFLTPESSAALNSAAVFIENHL